MSQFFEGQLHGFELSIFTNGDYRIVTYQNGTLYGPSVNYKASGELIKKGEYQQARVVKQKDELLDIERVSRYIK